MASPSYTFTLSNGSSADAGQVTQNFTDILNGVTDGTKDLSCFALTVADDLIISGDVTLGSASGDDVTISGSLAASIVIKTTNTYDIGASALALRSVYLASSDSAARATRLLGATVASNYTWTFPTSAGTNRYALNSTGSVTQWDEVRESKSIRNHGLTATVAASALTIAIKGADGNDPSSTNVVDIGFRSTTLATGTPLLRAVTSATSVVISSGSTLGHASGVAHYIYVYAIDNAGTVELAASTSFFDEGTRHTTTAEGGAGAADSGALLYSTTARSDVGIRLIGRLKSTQATAGTWATAISEISLPPFEVVKPYARASAGGAQTIANNVEAVVGFDTITEDNFNCITGTTTTWRYTAKIAGVYLVSAYVEFAPNNNHTFSVDGIQLKVNVDAILVAGIGFWTSWSAENVYPTINGSLAVRLAVGEYLTVSANNTAGLTDTIAAGSVISIAYLNQ